MNILVNIHVNFIIDIKQYLGIWWIKTNCYKNNQ